MATKTQRIAGHEFTLDIGARYRAARPLLSRTRDSHAEFPVTVYSLADGREQVAAYVPSLTYDQANGLVNSFNNGAMSFDGRIWS